MTFLKLMTGVLWISKINGEYHMGMGFFGFLDGNVRGTGSTEWQAQAKSRTLNLGGD